MRSLEPTRFGLSQEGKWSELEAQLDQDLKEATEARCDVPVVLKKNMPLSFCIKFVGFFR